MTIGRCSSLQLRARPRRTSSRSRSASLAEAHVLGALDALGAARRAATRSRAPMRSATRSHEKRERQRRRRRTSAAIHSTPEPAKPSQLHGSAAPSSVAEHAAGVAAGSRASHRYRRVHSSAALAASSSARPSQNSQRAASRRPAGAPDARRAQHPRASAPSQARSADQHQPTRPSSRTGRSARSESQAPSAPALLCSGAAAARGGEGRRRRRCAWPAPAAASSHSTAPASSASLRRASAGGAPRARRRRRRRRRGVGAERKSHGANAADARSAGVGPQRPSGTVMRGLWPTRPPRLYAQVSRCSRSLMITEPFSCVSTMPRSSRSFITRLTISREAPTILARSWRETLLRMILMLAVRLGHVEQRAGDAAVDVEQRQRLDLAVGAAQPLHQAAHDRVRQARVLGQAARELGAAEDQHVGLHLGAHRGRMRLVVDQAHLADVVARLQHGEDHLAAARVGGQHAGAAGQQDEQRVRLLALLDDDLAAPEAPLDDAVGDALRPASCVSSENSGTRRIRSRLDSIDI